MQYLNKLQLAFFFFGLAGDQDALQHARYVCSTNGGFSHPGFLHVTQILSSTHTSQ